MLPLVPAVFLAAFLAFWVELLMARYLLPWFGGGPWVWTAVSLFFQLALLGGYGYAHFLGKLAPRRQALVHALAIGLGAVTLDLVPEAPQLSDGRLPIAPLLGLLARHGGLAFLLLTTSAPLLASWASDRGATRPWALFAFSNLGALLALGLHPFVIEPRFARGVQAQAWTLGFWLWSALMLAVLYLLARRSPAQAAKPRSGARPPWRTVALWVTLSALAVAAMLAITRDLSARVTPLPMLWAAPLAIYLLTFALAFAGARWSPRAFVFPGLAVAALWLGLTLRGHEVSAFAQLLGSRLSALFFVTWALHGELYRRRPEDGTVTGFSLAMAVGGALGGAAMSVAAPLLLPLDLDLGLTMVGSGLALAVATGRSSWRWLLLPGTLALAWAFAQVELLHSEGRLRVLRSAYGTLSVHELGHGRPGWLRREVLNGSISHGMQYLEGDNRLQPTTYFTVNSGGGLAAMARGAEPKKVGLAGLGVGVLLAYAGPEDDWRVYELDPNMVKIAREDFGYVRQAPCPVEIVVGDARRSMEEEEDQNFDLLLLDAFQGDAIPTHMLTAEAFELYGRHLAPDGILAVHATSAHLELRGLLASQAQAAGLAGVWIERPMRVDERGFASRWAVLTNDAGVLNRLMRLRGVEVLKPNGTQRWTDEFAPLWPLVR